MKRLILVIFVLLVVCGAARAGTQTPDERRCELAALHGLDWAECVVTPPPPPPPPPTGALADAVWTRMPDSAMDSVFVPGVDDVFPAGQHNSWRAIQGAWSGGVCVEDELVVWGGGHGDGIHNGVLGMNVHTGTWRRITEPSPFWTEATCPGDVCPAPRGNCTLGMCKEFSDGRPIPPHTYYALAYDGQDEMFVSGGRPLVSRAIDPPNTWSFSFSAREWTALALNPIAKGHGGLDQIGNEVYFHSGGGYRIYDTSTDTWFDPPGNMSGRGGQVATVYDPEHDRIYFLGRGNSFYFPRANYGDGDFRVQVADPPEIIAENYLGITYYTPENLILLWDGGTTVTTLNTETNLYGSLTLAGEDPGPDLKNGTMRRFSYCGGRVVLVNGNANDAFYLDVGVEPDPDPDPDPDPLPPVLGAAPYYVTPPGDALVEAQCGSFEDWDVVDVRTNEDVQQLNRLDADSATVIRIHHRDEPYPTIRVKGKRCLKVIGIPGPNGEKPHVADVNATRSFRGSIRDGGIIIENLHVSPGKAQALGVDAGGVCLGMPNDQRFFIVRDTDVGQCAAHAFITSHAHHMYVEIGRSTFEQAGSHLAYIDHVAMAYVYDSTFQSPGWGHALRCIALRCVIENVQVSNVQLDGTELPVGGDNILNPNRRYLGMQPLEIYVCGESELKNIHAVFRRKEGGGTFAATLRARDAMQACDIGHPVDGEWTSLRWGDVGYDAETYPLVLNVDGMTVECVGLSCFGWDAKSGYPIMNDAQKAELRQWLKDGAYATWNEMVAALPNETWREVVALVTDNWKPSFLKGSLTNKVPLPVSSDWSQRSMLRISGLSVINGSDLRPLKSAISYCYGLPQVDGECLEQFDGRQFRRSFVEVR